MTWAVCCLLAGALQVVSGKALLRLAAQRPDLVLELGLRMSQGLKQQLGELEAIQQVGRWVCWHGWAKRQAGHACWCHMLSAATGVRPFPRLGPAVAGLILKPPSWHPQPQWLACSSAWQLCAQHGLLPHHMHACRVRSGVRAPCSPTWFQPPSVASWATASTQTGCGDRWVGAQSPRQAMAATLHIGSSDGGITPTSPQQPSFMWTWHGVGRWCLISRLRASAWILLAATVPLNSTSNRGTHSHAISTCVVAVFPSCRCWLRPRTRRAGRA